MFVDQVTFVGPDGVHYTDDASHDLGALRAEPRGGMVVFSRRVAGAGWSSEESWQQLCTVPGNRYEALHDAIAAEGLGQRVQAQPRLGPPEEVVHDPQRRREWIAQNMPAGFVPGADHDEQVDFLNAQFEWVYQAIMLIDEMPPWRETLHLRRIMRAAHALARDVGVELTTPDHAGYLLYGFLVRASEDDPDGEPEPEPEPAPTEEVPA